MKAATSSQAEAQKLPSKICDMGSLQYITLYYMAQDMKTMCKIDSR